MNIAEIAVVAIPCVSIGAFLGHTFLRGDSEARFNVSKPGDDAFTIARLTDELEVAKAALRPWQDAYKRTSAALGKALDENADLRIDIAAKAQRLSEAGLQSTGGIDPTVSA